MGNYYLVAFPESEEYLCPSDIKGHCSKQGDMIHGDVAKLAMMMMTRGSGPASVVGDCGDLYYEIEKKFKNVTAEAVADYNELFTYDGEFPLIELEVEE